MPLIAFEQVTVAVGGRTLLSDLSFTVASGRKVVLLGKSGSGKSTVLRCLLGLHPLTRGRIVYAGQTLDRDSIRRLRASAVYLGQEPVLGAKTVREALLLPFQFKAHRGQEPAEPDLLAVLDRLHLPAEVLKQDCARVSGGEKQRLALARGLLLGKHVYLLDEATSALDPESKRAVLAALSQPDITLLSVAHDPEWIAWCDTYFELNSGRLKEKHGRG